MIDVLPALPDAVWDVVQDDVGFSAEASVERLLGADEAALFEAAARVMAPVVRVEGQRRVRGIVTVDENALWIYVHAVGPGMYGDAAAVASRDMLSELWNAVHAAAAAL